MVNATDTADTAIRAGNKPVAAPSAHDIKATMALFSVLADVAQGRFPQTLITLLKEAGNSKSSEFDTIDTTSAQQYEALVKGLQQLAREGSVDRVAQAMCALSDPHNEILDPSSAELKRHPRRQAENNLRAKLSQAEQRLQWLINHPTAQHDTRCINTCGCVHYIVASLDAGEPGNSTGVRAKYIAYGASYEDCIDQFLAGDIKECR